MLGRKVIIQFLGTILSSFLSFLTLSLTARFFGVEILGQISYFLGVLGLILAFSDFGFSRAHIKFVAERTKIGEKIGVFLSIEFILLFFSSIIAFLYFFFFLRQSTSSYKALAFVILALYEFTFRFGSSILLTFEGLQQVAIENLVLGLSKFIKLFAVILFLFWAKNIIGLSLAYFFQGLVVLILAFVFINRFKPFSWGKRSFKKYLGYSLPFFVIYPLTYLAGNIDVVILKNFWTSSTVGYYTAAVGLTSFLKSLYGVFMTLFFPKMSQLFKEKRMDKMQQYTDMAIKYLLIIFMPIFLGLFFLRQEFINLVLGQEFQLSIDIFSLSLVGVLILMISSPYDYILYATGRHQILAPLTFLTTLLAILLQLVFVPKALLSFPLLALAGEGTILAKIISWSISASIQIYLVYRFFKIKPYSKSLLIFIFHFLFLVIFSILGLARQPVIWKILFLLINLALFCLFLLVSKVIDSSDLRYLKLVLDPKKIIKDGFREIVAS